MNEENRDLAVCRWWQRHRWGKWEQYEWRGVYRRGSESVGASEDRQKRKCLRCGKMQDERIA